MNQENIGKFIAGCRKSKNLTQSQLAEKLNITDRLISKWETGRCMPDSSIMLLLCKELDITVNELLTGERVSKDEYINKAEKNFVELKGYVEIKNFDKIVRTILIFLTLISLIIDILEITYFMYGDNYNMIFLNQLLSSKFYIVLLWTDNILIYFFALLYILSAIDSKKEILLKIIFSLFSVLTTFVLLVLIINIFVVRLFGVVLS